MSENETSTFCAENFFHSILTQGSPSMGYFADIMMEELSNNNREYDLAINSLASELMSNGFEVTDLAAPTKRPDYGILTKRVKGDLSKTDELHFFNIKPSVPDTILNGIATAITVGGIVNAPFTGGVSLLLSGVAMGLAIFNNRKKETDPQRIRVYDTIGVLLKKNSEYSLIVASNQSAYSPEEIAGVLKSPQSESMIIASSLLDSGLIMKIGENNENPHFLTSPISNITWSKEEKKTHSKLENMQRKKYRESARMNFYYPSVSQIADELGMTNLETSQALDVLKEKKIISEVSCNKQVGFCYST